MQENGALAVGRWGGAKKRTAVTGLRGRYSGAEVSLSLALIKKRCAMSMGGEGGKIIKFLKSWSKSFGVIPRAPLKIYVDQWRWWAHAVYRIGRGSEWPAKRRRQGHSLWRQSPAQYGDCAIALAAAAAGGAPPPLYPPSRCRQPPPAAASIRRLPQLFEMAATTNCGPGGPTP